MTASGQLKLTTILGCPSVTGSEGGFFEDMTEKEVMIGDWVQNTCGHKGKVIGFRYDTTDKDNEIVIAYHSNNTTWSQATLIEPIPLTKEILEANGWTYSKEYVEWYRDGVPFTVMTDCMSDGECGFVISSLDREFTLLLVDYVNSLQHALRLCGLNELADNFKIS